MMRANGKRIGVFVGLGAAVALSLLAVSCGDRTTRVETGGAQIQRGISVTGTGKVTGKPDIAKLTLGVSAEADTVQKARDQAAASLDAMIKSLKNNGVAEKDIQTQQFSIQPQYDYNEGKQQLRGFQVTNVLGITLRDINKTSQTVDDAVTAGGNNTQIQGLSFTIENPDDLKQQAREKAVADARAKAETLAKSAGVSVGDAITISESSVTPVFDARAGIAAPATGPGVSTPIQPGELDVTVDVSVTWGIK
jgi:uncharacterized protein